MTRTRLPHAAVLLFVLLAGCLGTGPGDDKPTAPPAPDDPTPDLDDTETGPDGAPTFAPSVLVARHDAHGFAGEPSVAVGPDGRILVAAPFIAPRDAAADGIVVQPGQGHVWRSLDGGATFETLNDARGMLAGERGSAGDVDVAADGGGRLYVVQGAEEGFLLLSHDGGDSWTYNGSVETRGHAIDRPWVATHGEQSVLLAWSVQEGGVREAVLRRSDDGGRTWTGPEGPTGPVAQVGPPAWGPDGTAHVPYVAADRSLHVLVARPGSGWTDEVVGHVVPEPTSPSARPTSPTVVFPVLGVDGAGTAYLAWSEYRPDGSTRVGLVHDAAGAWSEPRFLTEGGNALMPWLVAGAEGRVAVFLLGADTAGDPNVGVHEWTLRVLASSRADAPDAVFTEGLVTPEPVHVGSVCPHGAGCVGYATPFVGDRSLLDFFEATLTPDGDLVVAWTETHAESGRNPELRFARQAGGLRLA